MNSAINNVIKQYMSAFIEKVAEKYEINVEDLDNLWHETQKQKVKKSKKRHTTKKPTAYVLFCNEERPKLKGMSFTEIAKELGRLWRNAPDHVKDRFKALASERVVSTASATIPDINTDHTDIADDTNEKDTVSTTSADEVVVKVVEKEKKKPKKTKTPNIPNNITDERERDMWLEFAKLTITDLRTQCDHNNLKKSKNRNDMIHALVIHRIALEDGHSGLMDDDDDDDLSG